MLFGKTVHGYNSLLTWTFWPLQYRASRQTDSRNIDAIKVKQTLLNRTFSIPLKCGASSDAKLNVWYNLLENVFLAAICLWMVAIIKSFTWTLFRIMIVSPVFFLHENNWKGPPSGVLGGVIYRHLLLSGIIVTIVVN